MIKNWFSFLRTGIKLDHSSKVMWGDVLKQTGYDREIDEGRSSGSIRGATIDVSKSHIFLEEGIPIRPSSGEKM